MIKHHINGKFRLLLLLSLTPFLVGSQCAFLFNSGGNDDDDKDDDKIVVVAANGVFGSTPVAGANYTSGTIRGVTGRNGEFEYEPGSPVQFSVGDIQLGKPVNGKSLITTTDLVADNSTESSAQANITRLLQSLDSEPGDELITIPSQVRALAQRSNSDLYSYIEFLDFSDDTLFANAASQIVAVLTQDYPFTAVLPDEDGAP
jgi:hypothetical protein